ncbi:MAG TPA: histidine phosphatase family protein [Bryobacteraceae bacterium]
MIRILLMRHGNVDVMGRVVYGRMPGVHLNEEGKRQAEAAAHAIRERYRLNQVVSSPMERALETAKIVAGPQNLDVITEAAFNELDVGEWIGKTTEELRNAEEWKRYNRVRSLYAPPGGESLLNVQRRSWGALERICHRKTEGTVAVVTHGDVIRSLLLLFLGAPLDHILRLEVSPGSLSEVILGQGEPLIRGVNEIF